MANVASEDGDVGFQIAPMVDVVFVLMLFFMATVGAQIVQLELSINLPSGRSPAEASSVPTTPVMIDIGPDGSVVSNGQPMDSPDNPDLPQLTASLTVLVEQFGGKDPVIIRPHPDAAHQRVIDVLNAAAKARVTNLTFQ